MALVVIQAQTERLEPGIALAKEIGPSQKQYYQIRISPGRFCRITVQQTPGVDLIVALYDAKHRKLNVVGGFKGLPKIDFLFSLQASFDLTTLSFVAEVGGIYVVELDARDTYITGRYEIRIDDLNSATEEDRKRVEAERLFGKGDRLRLFARGIEDSQLALGHYEDALAIYRYIGDTMGEATALDAIGFTHLQLDADDKAVEYCSMALKLCQSAGDKRRSIAALIHLAAAHHAINQNEAATAEFEEALQISRVLQDRISEARVLYRYAGLQMKFVDDSVNRVKVVNLFRQSARILHELGSPIEESHAFFGLASYYAYLSDDRKAVEFYQKGLEVLRPIGFKRSIAFGLLRVGEIFLDRGDYQKAFDYYAEALEYTRNTNTQYEAYSLYNLSNPFLTFDKNKVLEHLTRALPMWEGNRNGEAYTLVSIGRWYFTEDQKFKALDYYSRALPIMRGTGDTYGAGIILSHIGETYFSVGDNAKAVEFYGKALELHRSAKARRDEARTLVRLGSVHQSSGEVDKASFGFQKALEIFREIGNRSGEANALYMIAKTERQRGNISAARPYMEAALQIVETLRAGIAGPELRLGYFSSVQLYYEFYIDILMSLHHRHPNEGFDRRAFETAERGSARSLLELLASSQIDLQEGVDTSLLDRENELQKRLDGKAAEQVRLLAGRHAESRAAAIEKEVDELTSGLQAIRGRINASSPRFAALTQTASLTVPEVQKLLSDDTVLLEYKLGEERSFLWLVAADGMKSFILPKRSELEKVARQVYEQLTVRNVKIKGETERQAQARFERADESFWKAAQELSTLLFGQVAAYLGEKRLIIVGDGALHYIPFSTLPEPENPNLNSPMARESAAIGRQPLLVSHEVVYLPSASTLAVLRREAAKRTAAPQTVAVLADPVFSQKDVRVRTPSDTKVSGNKAGGIVPAKPAIGFSTQRALVDLGLNEQTGIPRLPFSRHEAEMIIALAPAMTSLKALDFAANRSLATSSDLSKYRLVHFATHGLLNSAHPELSGLLFSLVNERGEPQNGFLPLQEIYKLKLNADMVVLSACQTGLGKEIRGEGLVGLTRGFMYAGTSRVVASLWKVDDAATAGLMHHFYTAILHERQSPAAALRTAQIRMLKENNWGQPYFWAAFTIQGEWK